MPEENKNSAEALKADDLCERRGLFGSELKAIRSERGLSVAEVAEKTRINSEFIVALESGNFELLPGRLFGRGFVAALVKHYSADKPSFVVTYDQLWTHDGIQQAISDSTKVRLHEKNNESVFSRWSARPNFRPGRLAVFILILIGFAGATYVGYKKGRQYFARVENDQANINVVPVHLDSKSEVDESASAHEVISAATQEKPAAATREESEDSPKAAGATPEAKKKDAAGMPGKQVLTITVIEPVKMKIESDEGKPAIKDFTEGVYSFNFESTADLLIYDAAAVRITFNGNPLGALGTKGRVRRIGFRSDAPNQKSF